MPIALGLAFAVWVLLVLAVIGAVLVGTAVVSMLRGMQRRFEGERGAGAWDATWLDSDVHEDEATLDDLDETEDWARGGWAAARPENATAWWWSSGASAPEMVIDTGRRSGATAVAEKPSAARTQIWTIHPDHTAHWQDEADACPWCRNEPGA